MRTATWCSFEGQREGGYSGGCVAEGWLFSDYCDACKLHYFEEARADAEKMRFALGLLERKEIELLDAVAVARARIAELEAALKTESHLASTHLAANEALRADAEKWKADAERLAEALTELTSIIDGIFEDSIAHASDYIDSFTTQPARAALKAHEATWRKR